MKVIITGTTGFLGSHLTRTLLSQGHEVIALKRATSDLHRVADLSTDIAFYDLENLDFARPFIEHAPIDVVIHTATCYGRSGESTTEIFSANTMLPLKLLETAAFFDTNCFFNTDTVLPAYLNAYSLSKKHFTDWGRQFASEGRVQFINVGLEHIYGPGDDASKFITWVTDRCLKNVPEIKLTTGTQHRDFIYISDAVSAFSLMLRNLGSLGAGFQEISLGSGETVTVRALVEMIHRLTASSSCLSFGALPHRDHEMMESRADTARLCSLGWECRVGLEEGISRLIEDVN